jgi:membrane glycosyltransferase
MSFDPQIIHKTATRRRWTLALATITVVAFSTLAMASSLSRGGWTVFKGALLALFVILLAQVVFGFIVAVTGWWLLGRKTDGPRISSTAGTEEIALPAAAIVIPIYNEDVGRVFQGLKVMFESLQRTPHADGFDFFVLSDSSDANCWIAEEQAWFEVCKQLHAFGRIFYRRRRVARHHKSGNIADFCRRWGASYRYMIVLDADSVMTGESFVKLTTLMEMNPGVGIIQTSPRPVLGRTLFQRIDQFAANVYRPMFAAGANFWQLSDATFWGHNAIVRLRPFIEYCAMPKLPEVGPLGTQILSHDTIEAALMHRAGFAVWQAYDLPGSYEEGPPNLLTSLQRDRRWCHGNMQHLWFLFERGLKSVSRLNIFLGIMAYVGSALWFFSMVLGVLVAFGSGSAAVAGSGNTPILLYIGVISLLLVPKALSVLYLLRWPRTTALCGGAGKVALSAALETVLSALQAPILMLFYTRFVFATLTGSVVSWGKQVRSAESGPGLGAWIRVHGGNTVFAILAFAFIAWQTRPLLAWMSPIFAGLLLAIPYSLMTASTKLGQRAKAEKLFLIPEETEPGPELAAVEEGFDIPMNPFFRATEYAADYGLLKAVLDPYVNAIHVSLLRQRAEGSPRTREHMAMLSNRLLFDGPLALTASEKKMLLGDVDSMLAMHQDLWSSPASYLHEWWQEAFRHYNESTALLTRRAVNH